ncbi:AAA family ATPase [Luteimonas granuli]|uniref:AAA family ATPase n=1 Tax=Luteimonas granuli TaxID=1176533 RepID=A0A518N6J9_9GAMM|nr:AAA family ATPase [Luteimonas granuli]QDW67537.1 AAA family ATPase [Luteimonas granuli]
MWVKRIEISGVGGIQELLLEFDDHINILCGPNGIGKTTILESVAHAFSAGQTTILKRHAKSESSKIDATVCVDSQDHTVVIVFKEFVPSQHAQIHALHQLSAKLISLKVNRTLDYRPLNSIEKDTKKELPQTYAEARQGVSLADVKNWFVNRYLFSKHANLSDSQFANYELARSSFSALSKDFTFSRVDPSTLEILVNSPSGEIYYEYLSSGFKSCLSIIFGIIKELEFRFPSPGIVAGEFDGVVLIDEVELHLHPEWQATVLPVLSHKFPKAQFICSTHSPHVIQAAQRHQIIAIEGEQGVVRQRPLPNSPFGFRGWTIEEVLVDVMGMSDLRTSEYRAATRAFERAIDSEDRVAAEESFKVLDEMLHPESHLRKMFLLQLSAVAGVP